MHYSINCTEEQLATEIFRYSAMIIYIVPPRDFCYNK